MSTVTTIYRVKAIITFVQCESRDYVLSMLVMMHTLLSPTPIVTDWALRSCFRMNKGGKMGNTAGICRQTQN